MNIECFGCSGGMAEGFRRAGVRFDMVFDSDPNACESYARNLKHRPIQMDVRNLLQLTRAGLFTPGPVELFVADPPCTPWSRAGKRLGVKDERDMLLVTTELIGLLRPAAYLIGNVPGLDDSPQWHHMQAALAPLHRAGYCIADYTSLDAADFGVPQHRRRPFWFGHLAGPCVRWPLPSHGRPGQPALAGMEIRPWVTCREALQHLPLELLGRPVRLKRADPKHQPMEPGAPAKVVTSTHATKARAENVLAVPERAPNPNYPADSPDGPSRTLTTQAGSTTMLEWPWGRPATSVSCDRKKRPPSTKGHQSARMGSPDQPGRTQDSRPNRVGQGDNKTLEWPWDRPSTTVCGGIDKIAPAGEHAGQFGPNAVVLSERAATILQGFPESWVFHGATKKARWSQLGQAMPPPLAEAVARAGVEQMKETE